MTHMRIFLVGTYEDILVGSYEDILVDSYEDILYLLVLVNQSLVREFEGLNDLQIVSQSPWLISETKPSIH